MTTIISNTFVKEQLTRLVLLNCTVNAHCVQHLVFLYHQNCLLWKCTMKSFNIASCAFFIRLNSLLHFYSLNRCSIKCIYVTFNMVIQQQTVSQGKPMRHPAFYTLIRTHDACNSDLRVLMQPQVHIGMPQQIRQLTFKISEHLCP